MVGLEFRGIVEIRVGVLKHVKIDTIHVVPIMSYLANPFKSRRCRSKEKRGNLKDLVK